MQPQLLTEVISQDGISDRDMASNTLIEACDTVSESRRFLE